MVMPFCIKFIFYAILSHTSSILKIHSSFNLSLEDNDQAFFSIS